jgi:SAM-dependent methyltransferase
MGAAIERWRELVLARREQMDAQLAALGGPPPDWWATRAPSFSRDIGDLRQPPAPGLTALVDRLDRTDTVLDIGAGAGRYAVPLARVTRHVTLVEPSAAMAAGARAAFERAGLANYALVERAWPVARVAPATAVLLANVLSPVLEIEEFLGRAAAAAQRWLCIVHGATIEAGRAVERVVRAFHGTPRVRQPDVAELLPVLHELGIRPELAMTQRRFGREYAGAREAARDIAATALVEQTPAALRRVARLIAPELQPRPGGRVALAPQLVPVGVLLWRAPGAS